MKQIGLVPELIVMDINKSTDFYVNTLGFSVVFEKKETDFIYLRKGNAEIMLEQPGKGRVWQTGEFKYPMGIGANFTIEAENVDELYEKIKKISWPIFMEMEDIEYHQTTKIVGNRQFIIQDPDGYLLRFYQMTGVKIL